MVDLDQLLFIRNQPNWKSYFREKVKEVFKLVTFRVTNAYLKIITLRFHWQLVLLKQIDGITCKFWDSWHYFYFLLVRLLLDSHDWCLRLEVDLRWEIAILIKLWIESAYLISSSSNFYNNLKFKIWKVISILLILNELVSDIKWHIGVKM